LNLFFTRHILVLIFLYFLLNPFITNKILRDIYLLTEIIQFAKYCGYFMNKFLKDERATINLATKFYNVLPENKSGWTILLNGELGSGKSTFARSFIKTAGYIGPVPSPTYTLIEPYDLPAVFIYHIDLYRVIDPEELEYLGWNDLEHGLRLVEWPERVPSLAANADINIELHYDGFSRRVLISGLSGRGISLIKNIKY
tara:strand:- start:5872 stop:6468 length:597 start_codon:yes stop_codon:yes gene_type:complete